MANLALAVDLGKADALLNRLIQFAGQPVVLTSTIGDCLLESTPDRFPEKTSPESVP